MIDFLFNPDWWTVENTFNLFDATFFLLFLIATLYLLIFALKSLGKPINVYPKARKKYRFAVIIPAYMEDRVISQSVESFFEQSYPRDKYDVFVVSDRMSELVNEELESFGAIVIRKNFQYSTKTKAIQEAIRYIDATGEKYDNVVILDADNLVDEYFLDKINDAFYSGCSAVQTHRVAKNYNSNIAILDSVSEEMNNAIFRKGHTQMGFSAGLIGSGMAFEYRLFSDCILKIRDTGIEKELEKYLLKNGYYIEYLSNIYTYDEKVTRKKQFSAQRSRWISSQIRNFFKGAWGTPMAALNGNWDYCNKLFQWALPPRIILLGLMIIICIVVTLFAGMMAVKWWILLVVLLIVFSIAIPDYLFNVSLLKAFISVPGLFLSMLGNTFIPTRRKRNTHTEHFE